MILSHSGKCGNGQIDTWIKKGGMIFSQHYHRLENCIPFKMRWWVFTILVGLAACHWSPEKSSKPSTSTPFHHDPHSYSNPAEVKVSHISLDLEVLFERKILKGTAILQLQDLSSKSSQLICDTSELLIEAIDTSTVEGSFTPAAFQLGRRDPVLGSPLTISLPPQTRKVRIRYATSPEASALQWLDPIQTSGKKMPFLYSQSQAIHARSWIPIQDSPSLRMTYSAHIRTPKGLLTVMSADKSSPSRENGESFFEMTQPIPAYLIAIAVGNLEFRALGKRTGVYAEPEILNRAVREFSDNEKTLELAEGLLGDYRWVRYDLLVLPFSAPYGGMENPTLTFVSPTTIAGDRSVLTIVAHELSHSWSGNLVTNSSWNDLWLNEGITTYIENRIIEVLYGKSKADMEMVIEKQALAKTMASQPAKDNALHLNLEGRDPEDGARDVAYVKGALFLKSLEETFGRNRFDSFLRSYFEHFAFQSVSSEDFVEFLKSNLLTQLPASSKVSSQEVLSSVHDWIYGSDLPANAAKLDSSALDAVEQQADRWVRDQISASKLQTSSWSALEWVHFLRYLSEKVTSQEMLELDRTFHLTSNSNSEITVEWLLLAIQKDYTKAFPRLDQFLSTVGRNKYVKPLYTELAKTQKGKQHAISIYSRVRPTYHPITTSAIDPILGWKEKPAG